LKIQGFLSTAVYDNKFKTGYNFQNISDDAEMNFIRTSEFPSSVKFRKYYFSNEGVASGKNILQLYRENASGILIIDEIGPWELEGGGWAESIDKLTKLQQYNMIWVVRKEILEDVFKKWDLKTPFIIEIPNTSTSDTKEMILKFFN
jgi:nucleoside-triphosphatase THEP1